MTVLQSHSKNLILASSRFASPLDRLAAFILDSLIVGIFTSLLSAPFQNQLNLGQFLRRTEFSPFWTICASALCLLFYIAYETFCIYFQSATFGQKFLRIKVEDMWTGSKPTLTASFARAFTRCFSMGLLLPFVGLFADNQRRTFHDRVANTIVTSQSPRRVSGPSEKEKKYSSAALFIASTVSALVICTGLAAYFAEFIKQNRISFSSLSGNAENSEFGEEAESAQCETVTNVVGKKTVGISSRLTTALALFAAGQIGEECLDQEADLEGPKTEQADRYQLAKAFSHSDEPELSDNYLAQVCVGAETTEACALSGILNKINDGAHAEAWAAFQRLLLRPIATDVSRIWAIRESEHEMKFSEELNLLQKMNDSPGPLATALADFLQIRESVALWGMDRKDEARALASGILPRLETTASTDLAQWMCQREVEDVCPDHPPRSCQWFSSRFAQDEHSRKDVQASLTYVRAKECAESTHIDYKKVQSETLNTSVADYVGALNLNLENKKVESKRKLLKLIQGTEVETDVQDQAFAKLIDFVSTKKEMSVLETRWLKTKELSWSWRSIGHHLFDHYREMKLDKDALRVGDVLYLHEPNNEQLKNNLILSAYRAERFDEAWKYLSHNVHSGKRDGRDIASVRRSDVFAEVVRNLKERFERK